MTGVSVVEVCTGARMHFGLICGAATTEWHFGGVGLMVREPGWVIRLRLKSDSGFELQCDAPEVRARVLRAWDAVIHQLHWSADAGSRQAFSELAILRAAPLHSGFGAGTQLTLALAAAAELLWTQQFSNDIHQTARNLNRAGRSAIGTEGFVVGGFIVDKGQPLDPTGYRALTRVAVPEHWRFVIVRPCNAAGISGVTESEFFSRRATMSPAEVGQLSSLITDQLLPAVRNSAFEQFAVALGEYGIAAGQFYASEQGGVFSCPEFNDLAADLSQAGIFGAAQSSWGPGICIPASSESHAEAIRDFVHEHIDPQTHAIIITEALNHGATIRSVAPETGSAMFA